MTPTVNPKLSIVIAAWNGAASLRQCLESLREQAAVADTEVIVAANFPSAGDEASFSNLSALTFPAGTTVPTLRASGIAAARGEIIALTEDHCLFDPQWCAEIRKAHELPYSVIGGSVENAGGQRTVDWAVYFYDYGRYMPPNPAGETGSLSGINVSYKRAALEEVRHSYSGGFFEVFVHGELRGRGHRLYMAPAAIVYHNKAYRFGSSFVQCFHLARSFAGRRLAWAGLPRRIIYASGALLLPVLLPARIVARVLAKGHHLSKLLLALPCIVVLMTSWSCGEFVGYLFGEGASAGKWR